MCYPLSRIVPKQKTNTIAVEWSSVSLKTIPKHHIAKDLSKTAVGYEPRATKYLPMKKENKMRINLIDLRLINSCEFTKADYETYKNMSLELEDDIIVRDEIEECLLDENDTFQIVGYNNSAEQLPLYHDEDENKFYGAIMLYNNMYGRIWAYFTENEFKEMKKFTRGDIDILKLD